MAGLPLRPPAILAKSAASLTSSPGVESSSAWCGRLRDAVAAMGGPGAPRRRRSRRPRRPSTSSGSSGAGRGESDTRARAHYQLAGVNTGPAPAHQIGIGVGASKPRMLDLIGRKADGWVPSAPWASPADLPAYLDRIQQAAVDVGRDPKALRCVYNVSGSVESSHSGDFSGPVSLPGQGAVTHRGVWCRRLHLLGGRWTHWDRPGCSARRSSPPSAQVGVDSTGNG